MAGRFEGQDFKFPDEAGDDDNTPDFEIEIEDDTPEEDRGRKPANADKVKKLEVEVDDLDKYSKDAKDKIIRMKRVWNDERRDKEQAQRELAAAVEAAKALHAENQRIKGLVNSRADEYQELVKDAAKVKLKAAKKAFKDAYEAGDSDAMTEAQEDMTRYQLELEKVKGGKAKKALQDDFGGVEPAQQTQAPAQQKPQQFKPDARVQEWQDENTWFGKDKVMTAAALGIHEDLKDQGYRIGSEEYYEALDKTVRKHFPDRFDDEEPDEKPRADQRKAKPSTVVASANRSTATKRIRLTQSQVAIAKRLGLTNEQYVNAMMQLNNG